MTRSSRILKRGLLTVGVLAGFACALPATGLASQQNVPVPSIPGAPTPPGPVAAAFTVPATVGTLAVSPQTGVAGTPVTITYQGLPANQSVSILWSTASNTWSVDGEQFTADYMGRASTPENVVLTTATTDANGALNAKVDIPQDWGGLHTFYAVINGAEVANGGFTVYRTATISPKSGPIGTPITITYRGLGASLYEGGAALLWDNKYVGELASIWTRGTATTVIRASGPVGVHSIQIGDAITYLYLNYQQSPLPWINGAHFNFRVTPPKVTVKVKGKARAKALAQALAKAENKLPPTRIDWPANVTPTDNQITTLDPTIQTASGVTASLSTKYGQVGAPVTVSASGLAPNTTINLSWTTVVGSRVNCTGTCWVPQGTALGTATTDAAGNLKAIVHVPDGLGGWHAIAIQQDGQTEAQLPFNMVRSVVGVGAPRVVKEGHMFAVHLKGLGWTQFDNTIAVDYDNSYVGYGCGFNSNGDTLMYLRATGGPGIHLIDMYPMLYTLSPSFANTPYGMTPYLTYAKDEPGLALGYRLPAIRLAIRVIR